MNQGDFKDGIQWGYQALKCNPEDVPIYHKIADLHLLEGDTRKAVRLLESLLKVKSITTENKFNTLVRLGNLCKLTQRIKKALDHFKEAKKLNPSNESLWEDPLFINDLLTYFPASYMTLLEFLFLFLLWIFGKI